MSRPVVADSVRPRWPWPNAKNALAWCGDALFLSTFDGVYAKRGDTIELVDMGDDDPATFYKVAAFGNLLWSIGAKDIMAYDGTAWTRID